MEKTGNNPTSQHSGKEETNYEFAGHPCNRLVSSHCRSWFCGCLKIYSGAHHIISNENRTQTIYKCHPNFILKRIFLKRLIGNMPKC